MKYLRSLSKILTHPENKKNYGKTILRILWWKVNQVFFKLPALYQLTATTQIICEPESSYGSYVIYARLPEYEEMQFIHDFLEPDDIVIDVGANIGAVTLLAADKVKRGKIFAFEPTPSIAKKLSKNVLLNKLNTRVAVLEKAVLNRTGTVSFTLEGESEVNHLSSTNSHTKNAQTIVVPATTLDTFISQNKLSKIDLLKVDVEGAELSVFLGATEALQTKKIKTIIFEVNSKLQQFNTTPQVLFSLLRKNGYELYEFTKDAKLRIFKNQVSSETTNIVATLTTISVKKRIKPFVIQ